MSVCAELTSYEKLNRKVDLANVCAWSACWEVNAWCNKAWKKLFTATNAHTIELIYSSNRPFAWNILLRWCHSANVQIGTQNQFSLCQYNNDYTWFFLNILFMEEGFLLSASTWITNSYCTQFAILQTHLYANTSLMRQACVCSYVLNLSVAMFIYFVANVRNNCSIFCIICNNNECSLHKQAHNNN